MSKKPTLINSLLLTLIFFFPFTLVFSQSSVNIFNNMHECSEHDHISDENEVQNQSLQSRNSVSRADVRVSLVDLHNHVLGNTTLTETALYDIRDMILEGSNSGHFKGSSNISIYEKGNNIIKDYEKKHGPLYTNTGIQSYATIDNHLDGKALARTMGKLYAAIFDAIDKTLITNRSGLVKNTVFGSHTYFPGEVTVTPSNTIYTVKIKASVPKDWGLPNLYSELAARRSTGAYLAPGTIGEVTVPASMVNKGYQIRVGAHSWDLSKKNVQKRLAVVTKLYPITSTTTKVANPMGGGIYIEVPHLANEGIVDVKIKNAIRSPFFSGRSFDKTSASKWQNTERNHPGPWTDIETDKVMMQVPSKWIRTMSYNEIIEILNEYHANTDLISDFMGKPHVRNKTILYMQVDVIFRGSAFYPGYPMGNYPNFNSNTPKSPLVKEHSFNQAFLHEHGHGTYMTKFSAETESAVHLLYPYVVTQRTNTSLEEGFSSSLHHSKRTDRTMDEIFISWALLDNFIEGNNMVRSEGAYQHKGHADYIEYVDIFGWKALTEFNRKLNVDFQQTGYFVPRNNHNSNDRILRLSREAGVDVRPLFHLWGHPPTNQAELVASLEKENLNIPSAEIYDKMVAYKSVIPMTQEKYVTWFDKTYNVINNSNEFYTNLKNNYDLSRAQASIDRIDELIAYYFPHGRPPVATVKAINETCGGGIGHLSIEFPNTASRSNIEFSVDGGKTYPYNYSDNKGEVSISNLPVGTYNVWVRWGNHDYPTDMGRYTISQNSGAPVATVTVINKECHVGAGDLSIEFPNNANRTNIEFSIDGGKTYPYNYPDNKGEVSISNLPFDTYNVWVRWGNGDCPVKLGNYTIKPISPLCISFAEPLNETSFKVGDDIDVTVNANNKNLVSDIKLFVNGKFVRSEKHFPYEWSVDNHNDLFLKDMAAGIYTLEAVATDNQGNKVKNSIEIIVTSKKATLFANCAYLGKKISLGVGAYPNIANVGLGKDILSSLRVSAGLKVTLFNNTNFGGSSISFTSDDGCLSNNNFNDKTASLKIEATGLSSRSSSQALVLLPEFGPKTKVNWIFQQKEDKKIKQYTVLHGTTEDSPLQEVGIVMASDDIGVGVYEFLHYDAQEGKNHYQIMVEYEDGSIFYPMWDDISFEGRSLNMHIAPNPATNYLKVDVTKYLDRKIEYSITSIEGMVIARGQFDTNHDKILELNLGSLQNGLYIIHVQPEGSRAVAAKFMVARDY